MYIIYVIIKLGWNVGSPGPATIAQDLQLLRLQAQGPANYFT